MRTCIRSSLKFAMLTALVSFVADASAEVVVIVSARSDVSSLTTEQAANIFLGKASTFPDNEEAIPVDQAEGSAVRNEFYSKVVHKNPAQLSAYWAKIIFTGDGRPPELMVGNEAVKKAVAGNPKAIGYIDRSALDDSVRVILAP